MNLYEINSQILDCIDQETGEVMDIDRLEELNMAKAEKVDNIACWVKNLEAVSYTHLYRSKGVGMAFTGSIQNRTVFAGVAKPALPRIYAFGGQCFS